MKKRLLILLLFPFFSFGQVQIGQDIDGEAEFDSSGRSVSLSSDGTIVAIGAPRNDGNGQTSGHVRVFENQGDNWIQLGQDIDGVGIDDLSGQSISLSSDGTILAIGAPGEFNEPIPGSIRIYKYENNNWIQIGNDIEGDIDISIGSSLSLSSDGTILAISGVFIIDNSPNLGFIRVFENQGGNWIQSTEDIVGEVGDSLGSFSLSSDGTIIAIGSQSFNTNILLGSVQIFENQEGIWTQMGQTINDNSDLSFFGSSISLSSDGSIVAISAPGPVGSDAGFVKVFENQGNNWVQIGDDFIGEAEGDNLGIGLSLSSDGSILGISAIGNDDNGDFSGKATIYKNLSGTWVQVGNEIVGELPEDGFGRKISLSSSGETVAISSSSHDNGRGHVRIFDLSEVLSTEEVIDLQFSMYPNPASTNVTIELNQNSILKKSTIYNSLGQLIKTSTETTIDTSDVSKGIYILEITTDQGKASKKLIIE